MKCCLCGSESFEQLWRNLEKESARHQSQPLDVKICTGCGLVCLDITELDPVALRAYYETTNTFERPGPLPEGHRAMREGQVRWALDHLPSGHGVRSALDIGCGAGYVCHLFQRAGFEVMGTDLSPAMIANLAETYGIQGRQGSFSPSLVGRTFDLVSCVCVLEHLLDPREAIRGMSAVLNPGGFLFLEVPDAEFPRWDTIVDHIAFDHIWHFTARTLPRLMEECGFEILATQQHVNPPDSGNPEAGLRVLGIKRDGGFERRYQASDYDHQKAALADYKQRHNAYLADFQQTIDRIVARTGGAPVAIFPGGEHTATLLSRFDLSKLNVTAIYDNDPAVTGKTLGGFPIRHGSQAEQGTERHFVLSTTNHEQAIHDDLKRRIPGCRVYGLYGSFD